MTIDALERALNSLGWWLSFWTSIVVIGLILEYSYDLNKLFTTKPFKRASLMPLGGALLITIGVAGELYVDFRASTVETKLRALNDAAVAEFNNEAADARKFAGEAEERAAQLEAQLGGRQLTRSQTEAISNSLKRFAGRNLFITSYSGDAEAARLGMQIEAALELADIHADNNLGRTLAERGGVEFRVHVSGPAQDKEFIEAIARSLRTDGGIEAFSHVVIPTMRIENNIIGIMVALKPLPPVK